MLAYYMINVTVEQVIGISFWGDIKAIQAYFPIRLSIHVSVWKQSSRKSF